MVRTVVPAVQMSTLCFQLTVDPLHERFKLFDRIISAGDSCLIGQYDHQEPGIIGRFDRFDGTLRPFKAIRVAHVSVIDIQDPIAIE